MNWGADVSTSTTYGLHFVHVWRKEGAFTDVTFFRDVPTIVENYTYADPFGPATAVLNFQQITGFDSIPWLRENTNVDITFVPATTDSWEPIHGHPEQMIIDPTTNTKRLYLHEYSNVIDPETGDYELQKPCWEGFMVSIEPTRNGVTVQCQGAMYQLDRYYAKPLNPLQPRSVEGVFCRYFDKRRRGIWLNDLSIPELSDPTWHIKGYTDEIRANIALAEGRYTPLDVVEIADDAHPDEWVNPSSSEEGAAANQKNSRWTGFLTRNTGAWEKILTGYIQGQLSYMYTDVDGGGLYQTGDQWTMTLDPGRNPRMYIRRKDKAPTVEAWYEQPGVESALVRDGNQIANTFYGSGKGANSAGDTQWNEMLQPTGLWSIYRPIATITTPDGYGVYHYPELGVDENPSFWNGTSMVTWDGVPPKPAGQEIPWPAKRINDADGNPVYPANQPVMADLPDGYNAFYERDNEIWLAEKMVQFPDGIDLPAARKIAENWVVKESDPGWSGSITLRVDLRDPNGNIVSKWSLREGDVIVLKGFQGQNTATYGVNKFHISQVTMNPVDLSVQLTVDTKFRDLLSVDEAIARGRDTLSPVKSLQVNRRSSMINDLIVPWNNKEGSGMVPRPARGTIFTSQFPHVQDTTTSGNKPIDIFTPEYLSASAPGDSNGTGDAIGWHGAREYWLDWRDPKCVAVKNHKDALYVPVHAGAINLTQRWACVPIMLSQQGTIVRSEFAFYDYNGELAPIEFHISIYNAPNVAITSMPWQADDITGVPLYTPKQHEALWDGAFEEYDKTTGFQYNQISAHMPNVPMFIGWGNYDQPAGYSPVRKDIGVRPTGMLVDGAPWSFNYFGDNVNGFTTVKSSNWTPDDYQNRTMGTLAVYARIPTDIGLTAEEIAKYEWVYLRGRLYHGVGG